MPGRNMWIAITVLLYTLATLHMAIGAAFQNDVLTDHGGNPDVLAAYTHMNPVSKGIAASAFILLVFLADVIFVRRSYHSNKVGY